MRAIELLAPAKNLECGMAAIDHGADAVYIGAARFGARAAAGNSIDDIRQLCAYAHTYGAKVYVTVNTILMDGEINDTQALIHQLYQAGADALLVQDMGVLNMQLPPIALHASTQTDNRTPEKVEWLRQRGFERVVLARELSAREIRDIHGAVPGVELEVFVHGALCVSYSGLCYASQHCFGRSANRGECAQFCRMKFDLEDANGKTIEHQRHLLSLKDLCQYDVLEQILDAGATSLKIEGRLKDITYVKNVTAAYSKRLDEIIARNPDKYRRASLGKCTYTFTPNLKKTFNRGFTHYFLEGRCPDIASFDTPKAMGEYVGDVKEISPRSFTVAGTATFANGDGLCYINDKRELEGFRVNKAENNRIYPLQMPQRLRKGDALYRNNDQAFEKTLSRPTSQRKMSVNMELMSTPEGFAVKADVENIIQTTCAIAAEHQKAQKSQVENIQRQLGKMGNTPFRLNRLLLTGDVQQAFIPSSVLTELRRQVTDRLLEALQEHFATRRGRPQGTTSSTTNSSVKGSNCYPSGHTYLYNVSNRLSRSFYEKLDGNNISWAFERQEKPNAMLMQCKHCLRYALGYCVKHGGKHPQWREPLSLRLADGRRFELRFNCKSCQMEVISTEESSLHKK